MLAVLCRTGHSVYTARCLECWKDIWGSSTEDFIHLTRVVTPTGDHVCHPIITLKLQRVLFTRKLSKKEGSNQKCCKLSKMRNRTNYLKFTEYTSHIAHHISNRNNAIIFHHDVCCVDCWCWIWHGFGRK